MATKPTIARTAGDMIAEARKASGLSLARLAAAMGGLSVPFIHDVEHGRRKLKASRWKTLATALPSIDMRAFAEATLASGTVEIDATALTPRQRTGLVEALMAQAEGNGG